MPDVANYGRETERVVRTLQLLANLESDEERACNEWSTDFGATGGDWSLKCALDLLELGGAADPQACQAYLIAGRRTRGREEAFADFDLVTDQVTRYFWGLALLASLGSFSITEDDMLRQRAEPAEPLDLAARMAAEGVGDDPQRQLEFIVSEMDPNLKRDFQAFAGAMTTLFEIDEAYLESDPSHGQDDDPTG